MTRRKAVVLAALCACLMLPAAGSAVQTAAQRTAALAVADGRQGVEYLIHHHPSEAVTLALSKYGHWGVDSGGTISRSAARVPLARTLGGCAGLWWDRHYFYVGPVTVAWVKLYQGGWCYSYLPAAITSFQGQWTSRWSTAPWCWYNIGDAYGYWYSRPTWRRSGEESDLSPWLPGPGCLDTTVSGGDVTDWVGYGMQADVPTEDLH